MDALDSVNDLLVCQISDAGSGRSECSGEGDGACLRSRLLQICPAFTSEVKRNTASRSLLFGSPAFRPFHGMKRPIPLGRDVPLASRVKGGLDRLCLL